MSFPACRSVRRPARPATPAAALRGLALVLLALLAWLLPAAARAVAYGASASAATAAAYPWIDISASGTSISLGDDVVSGSFNIGFNVDIGNVTYSKVAVSSNGMVQFGTTSNAYANAALPLDGTSSKPNIDAALLPLWDDLNPGANQVKYAVTGTAPNRVFVVSWLAVPFYSGGGTATFQVQIHEQGNIVYRYQSVTGSGGGATVGLEVSNTDYVQWSLNTGVLANDTTILWTRTPPTPTLAYLFNEQSWNGTAGEVLDSAGTNHGTAAGLVGKASTSASSPAVPGPVGTCGYGSFDRSDKDHVLAPSTVGDANGSTFTITAWFRTTDPSLVGQRIVADDENQTGWGVSLGDPGTGRVRFYARGANVNLDTGNVVVANTWYFLVASVDATAKKMYLTIYSATGTTLAAVNAGYGGSGIGADAGRTTIGGNSNAAKDNTSGFGFSGQIDEVRGYGSNLVTSDHHLVRNLTSTCPAYLVASFNFGEAAYTGASGELKDNAGYGGGPFNGTGVGSSLPGVASTSPVRNGSPGTCSYATLGGPTGGGAGFTINGLPLSTAAGAQTTVAFWMYWDGTNSVMPIGFDQQDLWLMSGHFGFNTNNSDVYGIANSTLANGWHHVVAVFTNGSVTSNQLWIDGSLQPLTQRMGTPALARAVVATSMRLGGFNANTNYRFTGRLDQVRVYNGAVTAAQVAALVTENGSTCSPPLHHLAIEHASGTGLTCAPTTLTVKACQDAACSALYTGGVTGALSASGGTVVWPDGSGFSITAGSSSTTVRMQSTTTTATLLGGTASSPTASNATTCNFGSPSCTYTATASALVLTVPNHVAETSATVTLSAVGSSGGSCVSALASATRNVNFKCSYADPSTGTLPARLTGGALNSANSATAACDGTGRTVSLTFNASGVATTSLLYADVGQVRLTATYTGSAATGDNGLTMTGSALFIAAPDHFTIDNVTAGPIRAGSTFSATVTSRNSAGAATPNHGRESAPQQAYVGWLRVQPTGSGAVDGVFSGTGARSFSSGAVTASDLSWTEVGRGDLVARGSDGNGYLGSGMHVFGSSVAAGARHCALEGGSCALPGGTTAVVYYGAPGGWAMKTGQNGTVSCDNATFGDPLVGTVKRCYYVASSATTGSVGSFIPHRFTVVAPNSCGAFTYAGQPATATVTAQNAAGNTTANFNGTATTTPTFAQAVTLSDANALGLGTLSGASIAASAFSAGVATSQVSYAFTTKATAPQNLLLRAGNGGSGSSLVSSQGYTEATLALRSGRLRLSNAFGRANADLQVPVVTEYWSGNAWVLNSADNCTTIAGNAVALGNPRSSSGAASSATSAAGGLAISGGNGSFNLAAPSPAGSSLSLDLAVNLGSTAADQSCWSTHPATTGAGQPWLRAQNGSCAATADRDPAARASFGIYSPETRKTVHVRELF